MRRRRAKWGPTSAGPRKLSRGYRLRLCRLRDREARQMIEEALRA